MDSFSEQPRIIKRSQRIEQLYPNLVVPEVSMIVQNEINGGSPGSPVDSMLLTYKAWKDRNCNNPTKTNTVLPSPSDCLKKQVRFENCMTSNSPNTGKTLEQIYLASIPNRQLDVSLIDSCKATSNKENIENIDPNVNGNATTGTSSNDVSTDLFISDAQTVSKDSYKGYKRNRNYQFGEKLLSKQYLQERDQYDDTKINKVDSNECSCTQKHCSNSNNVTESNQPTTTDLLKIIHQQNEQLLILQKQVASLLGTTNTSVPKQIQAPQPENYLTSTQIEKPTIPAWKRPAQQFSLGVMTSFEVSIRRQQNLNRGCKDYYQSKITEITESSSKTSENGTDKGNPARVICGGTVGVNQNNECSMDNIINIDMKDYSSDGSSEDEMEDSANGGWTFYNNIMGQVNDIFKKSGIQPFPVTEKHTASNEVSKDLFKHNVMKKVKEATVKHLKSIGVHIPGSNFSNEQLGCSSDDSDVDNVSFAVKQLLMKYLPDDQLAKVPILQEQNIRHEGNRQKGLIQRRPDFSMATLQYMQKYNLLTDDNLNNPRALQTQTSSQPSSNYERILDITAIRQQPKLL